MIEHEWATSQDTRAMLELITPGESRGVGKLKSWMTSDRKLRLWVEACREATRKSGNTWLDLNGPDQPMRSARTWATSIGEQVGLSFGVRANLLREIIGNPHHPVTLPKRLECVHCRGRGFVYDYRANHLPGDTKCWVCDGRSHQPCPWLTPTVVGMAKYAYESLDFSGLPVLADALEEAGCDNQNLLRHLRGQKMRACARCSGTGTCPHCQDGHIWVRNDAPHVRGCFVLDLLLGLE